MAKKTKASNQEISPVLGDLNALPRMDFKPTAYGRDEAQGVLIAIRQQPGFPGSIGLHATALNCAADRVLLDYAAAGVAVRFRVNGIWENLPPLDRVTGDNILLVLKRLWGMNPTDRRSKQAGKCALHYKGIDWLVEATAQGVPNGERVLIHLFPKKTHLKTLSDLGMRAKMEQTLKDYLNGHGGMVVISGPPGAGLPTTWNVAIENTDKFIRDFISIENKDDQDPEIINVSKVLFDSAAGETPEGVLTRRLLRQPDAFVMPSLFNEETLALLVKEMTKEDRHVITRVVANDAIEAAAQLVKTYPKQAKDFVPRLTAILNQRLVRRLCDQCKQAFVPNPALLQKLGIPEGRVAKLFQPFIPPPPEQRVDAKGNPIEIQICKQCNGRGYFGRMALFELLELNDEFRAALLKNPDPEFLRPIAVRLGHRSFQEEGILAIALGLTSIQEMQRLMQTNSR